MIKKKSNKIIFITISTLFLLLVTLLIIKNITTNHEIKTINDKIETVNKNDVFEIWAIDGGLSYVLDDVVEGYRSKYPDINFIIKSFSERIYYKTILSAAATNSLPDMFYTPGEAELKELVELGIVEDITLTTEFRNIKEEMLDGALDGYTFEDRVYGMPVFAWDAIMYCNKEMFARARVEYPSNYEELVIAINEFKKHGIIPISIAGKDAWTQSMYYMAFALEEGSVEENKKIADDAKTFNSKQFEEAAKKLQNISNLDPWKQDYINISIAESVDGFIYKQCAMILSGSWLSTSIDANQYGIGSEDVEIVKFPAMLKEGIGGYSDGFALSKTDETDKLNELIYIEMMREVSDYAVLKRGIGLPVYIDQNLEDTKFEVLKECHRLFPEISHSAYDRILPSKRKEIYNTAIKELVGGNIDSEEFIQSVNKE